MSEHRLMRTESQVGGFTGLLLNGRWVCSCGKHGRWVQNEYVRASHKAHVRRAKEADQKTHSVPTEPRSADGGSPHG